MTSCEIPTEWIEEKARRDSKRKHRAVPGVYLI